MMVDSNMGKQSVESRFGGSWFHALNVVGSLGKDFLKTNSIVLADTVMEGICQKLKCPKMLDTW